MSDFYRKEAMGYATRRLSGDVVLATPLGFRIICALVVVTVAVGSVFVATASYARKETVTGWITPDAGMIRLAARQGGTLQTLNVREGDLVRPGQPVAIIKLSSELSGGDAYDALKQSLSAQSGAAQAKAVAAVQALGNEERQLIQRRSVLQQELTEARSRAELQQRRVAFANAEIDRAETIAAQGFLPRRELEARRSAGLAEDQTLSELRAGALALQREIGDVSARLAAIPIDMQTASAEAQAATADIDERRTETESQSTYIVVASVAGRVTALPVQQGQTLSPGATVAVMTPEGSHLQAELYAPSRAAGFIRNGEEVRLMYEAFPHQKFGTGEGRVISVSRTVLAPSEVAIPGLTFQEPVFRVRVALVRDSVVAYDETLPLQPGMLLSADVVIDKRSLLEWLLDPLYAAGRR